MNFERAYPVFIVLCMVGGGILAHRSGASPAMGVAVGLVVGMLPAFLLGGFVALMLSWCPERPPCICGQCNSEDYFSIGPMHKSEDGAYYYECPRCGREYRSHGPKYDLKNEDGYSPYMEKSRWHRWKRSSQQSL